MNSETVMTGGIFDGSEIHLSGQISELIFTSSTGAVKAIKPDVRCGDPDRGSNLPYKRAKIECRLIARTSAVLSESARIPGANSRFCLSDRNGWGQIRAKQAFTRGRIVSVLGVPAEFYLFGITLSGIALFHRGALWVALSGLATVVLFKLAFTGFAHGQGLSGLTAHLAEEWVLLANLLLLLLGFGVLANQFERSNLPEAIPGWLPSGWIGGLVLLGLVFLFSTFMDNIAGAVVGGVVARHAYRSRVHLGFLAAVVAAANAGGAGSVVGDTTTTMIWIAGIPAWHVTPAFIGATMAFVLFGVVAARQQHRFAPIQPQLGPRSAVDHGRLGVVAILLLSLLGANIGVGIWAPQLEHSLPIIGLGLWGAISVTAFYRRPDWTVLGPAVKGAVFLLALVAAASLMPVESLPAPSWQSVFSLGAVSAFFDNIPLTALALAQGGYDWALLAYAMGMGGSSLWFGSSAGVALTNLFPEGRSTIRWLRDGWHVPAAYVLGFFVLLVVRGWKT